MDIRFALLLACFFLSGFAALLYQTAWTRELSFVFGTSELAVAAVLAAYMGGLALGAAAAARYATRLRRPVLAYGVLELAIALSALSVPVGIRLLNALYVALLGGASELPESGASGTALFQLGSAFAVLLPPTAFMGATLPLLARHAVRNEAEIGSRVGVLYAVNTAGAIAGTVLAGFWLMPELGLRRTVWVGVALNGAVFALAALLARGIAVLPPAAAPRSDASREGLGVATWILPAIAVSGAVSFAYEVLWTRLLGHLLGASIQAFATMLASFLLGIALGSAVAARVAASRERAALGFGVTQLGIALASYVTFVLADRLPELSHRLGAGPDAALASAGVAVAALLPITLCIGATFPFAVRLLARHPDQAAGATARVYAWNTVGAIAGALAAGFVLLPGLGFAGTLMLGVAANLGLAALTALAARPRRLPLVAVAAAGGLALAVLPARPPWELLSSSPLVVKRERGEILYAAVGRSSTVLLFEQGFHFRLASNGLPEAKIDGAGVLPQEAVAHWLSLLPALLRPEAQDLLVVGLGGGTALEPSPGTIASIDVVELEPEVLAANQRIAGARAIDPLADPRVHVHIGDARGALQLTEKRYDAIVSQPSHPWTAGASHLYTREFFSLVRSRLQPGGVFVQWIGLGFVDESLLRTLVATLADVFEHVEVYRPRPRGVLFAASDAPIDALAGAARALRAAPEDYARFGVHRIEDVAAARALDDAGARALAQGAPLNTDDHNLLASRAARLGDASLDGPAVQALFRDLDPLLQGMDGLDVPALMRRLASRNFHDRARDLALSLTGVPEELALGWIAFRLGRPERAARHFARARDLDPSSHEARAGLVVSRLSILGPNAPFPAIDETKLEGDLAVVVAARRLAHGGDWDAVAALDAGLGRIRPGEALFEEASRLRAEWRLAAGDAQAGAEALEIANTLLSRAWGPGDALLRARAALAAGQSAAAWASLSRLVDRLAANQRSEAVLRRALEIAQQLPEEDSRGLHLRLARLADGGPPIP